MKAIVVEDSRLAREGLLRMLQEFTGLDVVGSADHPETAYSLIRKKQPDVIFLDIHMPGQSGFELLEKLEYEPKIIFTTAYSEYAYRSFDYNTVDYLLKPISPQRLAEAVTKLESPVEEDSEPTHNRLEISSKMFIKDGDECHLVTLSSIRYFESCKNYVRAFFDDQNAFIKKALNTIESRLPARNFFRVSRQYIVNLNEIKAINESVGDGYELTMSDGKVLEVSRRNATELKKRLSF